MLRPANLAEIARRKREISRPPLGKESRIRPASDASFLAETPDCPANRGIPGPRKRSGQRNPIAPTASGGYVLSLAFPCPVVGLVLSLMPVRRGHAPARRRKPCAGAYVSRRLAAACRSTPTTRASPRKSNTHPAVMHREAMDHGMCSGSVRFPTSAPSPCCSASKGCGQRNYKRSWMLL